MEELTQNRRSLVIFGTGQFAELALNYFLSTNSFDVLAFCVDKDWPAPEMFLDRPVVVSDAVTSTFPPESHSMFVAIGYSKLNSHRRRVYRWAKELGYPLATYISPQAFISESVQIGDNCMVMENNVLQHRVVIGDNTVLWSGNHVGHHSVIGSHVFVTSHCVVSGNVQVGDSSMLGVNCTIQDGIRIGSSCFVGPAALVRQDMADESVILAPSGELQKFSSRMLNL
jgi:sugar O-acyltransferase (sialic acid O-acetyltransferase NeuD family)